MSLVVVIGSFARLYPLGSSCVVAFWCRRRTRGGYLSRFIVRRPSGRVTPLPQGSGAYLFSCLRPKGALLSQGPDCTLSPLESLVPVCTGARLAVTSTSGPAGDPVSRDPLVPCHRPHKAPLPPLHFVRYMAFRNQPIYIDAPTSRSGPGLPR